MNFGKFKDAESLLRSYENLEKEFTKKCQELARLRFAKINENEMNTEGGALPRGGEIEKTEADTKKMRIQGASGVNSNISNINVENGGGSVFEFERVLRKNPAQKTKNETIVENGGSNMEDSKMESGGSVYELGRFAKKSTTNAENELSVESGKSERVDDKMVSGKSERVDGKMASGKSESEAFGMKNNAEIKIGERVTKDKINRKGEVFLDKVYPPEESKCSKSKIENGETFSGSDLEEAGADRSSPFCGILESARSVLEGSALSENNKGEEELLRENLSFDESGSGNVNGSFNENESLYRHQSLSENRSSFKNGSGVESAQLFNQGDNLKAQKNGWSYGNDEESNINFGKNETEREGKIENVPTNVNASKPENAVIGTMTPELLELMLEKARTDGVQDYIKRVLDKKSNSPKLLGKSVRGDGLILNSGVKPLENIREAGNYILKNYFFD